MGRYRMARDNGFFFLMNEFEEQFLQKKSNLLAHKDVAIWTFQRMASQVCLTGRFVL